MDGAAAENTILQADLDLINSGIRKKLWDEKDPWIRSKIAIDLSHIKVFRTFLASNAEIALVLEDDAVVSSSSTKQNDGGVQLLILSLKKVLCAMPEDGELLYLSAFTSKLGDFVGNRVRIFWDGSGTTGYFMTRKFAHTMLAEYSRRPPRLWIDLLMAAMIKAGEIQAYICDPPLIQVAEELGTTVQSERPKIGALGLFDDLVVKYG